MRVVRVTGKGGREKRGQEFVMREKRAWGGGREQAGWTRMAQVFRSWHSGVWDLERGRTRREHLCRHQEDRGTCSSWLRRRRNREEEKRQRWAVPCELPRPVLFFPVWCFHDREGTSTLPAPDCLTPDWGPFLSLPGSPWLAPPNLTRPRNSLCLALANLKAGSVFLGDPRVHERNSISSGQSKKIIKELALTLGTRLPVPDEFLVNLM